MRRPRTKLQVSTFPFLAVLLCAMGALLLLLFLMDRRAKIAAQHTVSEAVAERKKRTEEEEASRKAEWEKARDLLHQSLLAQDGLVKADAGQVQQSLDAAGKKLALMQAHHSDLHGKIDGEAARIAALESHLARQRAGLGNTEKQEARAKAELIAAASELAELERAFEQLKALRSRDKHVYSIVPYHGKRGDQRTPIYVECLRSRILFHRESKSLDGLEFTPDSLRREVERRSGPLAIEKSIKEKSRSLIEERKGPYVLFLVRPEGIANYYKAQAALKGYEVDFGYELVDSDWVLDFNDAPGARPASNPTLAKIDTPRPVERVQVAPPGIQVGTRPGSVGSGGPPTSTSVSPFGPPPIGMGSPGVGGVPIPPPIEMGSPGAGGVPIPPPIGLPSRGSVGGQGPPPIGLPSPGTVGVQGPPPIGMASPGSVGLQGPPPIGLPPRGAVGTQGPPPIGNPAPVGIDTGIPSRGGPAFVPINKLPAPVPIASSGNSPSGGTPANPPPGSREGGAPGLAPINTPIPGNNVGGKPEGSANGNPTPPQDDTGESIGRSPSGFAPGNAPKPKPPAAPVNKLFGTRDFVITIDCYTSHVTVLPSGLQFRWTAANDPATDKSLVQTVANLIERRQASARPGEPPYRPLIRFQVAADGLRTYYRVYPLLEPLRVPMMRENVEE